MDRNQGAQGYCVDLSQRRNLADQAKGCLLVGAICLCLAACGEAERSTVIATGEGLEISRAEFDGFLGLKMGELMGGELSDSIRSQMLDEYIQRRLVLREAARSDLTVTDVEIEQAALQDPQVKSTAATDDARRELANDLLIAKYYRQVVLRDVRVSPEEVQKYLDENKDSLGDRPAFYVREIRVDNREQAENLRTEVTDLKRDFAEVARLNSQAPSAEQGGLARYFEGQMPAVLDRAIRSLAPGDISSVIQSSFGYHIFKLERRVQRRPYDERRAQLDERRSNLIEELIGRRNQDAVDRALEQIVSSANVRVHASSLGFTYTGRMMHN